LNLKWKEIAGGFVYLTKTKMDKPRQIPVNDRLIEVLKRIRQYQWKKGIASQYVFTYGGRLPDDPVEHFCGVFEGGPWLTRALLDERERDRKRESK